jgi:hypothetical protein
MSHLKERLNNPQVFRVYRGMIENAPLEVVQDLRKNLQEEAGDHAKTVILEEFFVKRLGS